MEKETQDRVSIYEIGYLIVSNIPEETIPVEAEKIKSVIVRSGATVIADEAPYLLNLEYTMRKKNVSGGYEKFDSAYFGWTKFELSSDKIEDLKKEIESMSSVLRMLLITTVRENTFLGKRAPAILAKESSSDEEKKDIPPATVEEMDKSIDDMVKEV